VSAAAALPQRRVAARRRLLLLHSPPPPLRPPCTRPPCACRPRLVPARSFKCNEQAGGDRLAGVGVSSEEGQQHTYIFTIETSRVW
jgi:hypothetical protein